MDLPAKIAILVTSRVEGNVNHNLMTLLDSLQKFTQFPETIEVLIKYDYCDQHADQRLSDIANRNYPFKVFQCRGPRGRGYIDIHHGYNLLLPEVSKDVEIVGAMADDFTVRQGWNQDIWIAAHLTELEHFIIHQRPHPRKKWNGADNKYDSALDVQFDMSNDMFDSADLHIIDEAPMWSKKLIDVVGYFPVSFTDAWTVCLEHVLWNKYGLDLTQFVREIGIERKTCDVDQPGDPRWDGDRKTNFDYIKSDEFKQIVQQQAEKISQTLAEVRV